MCPHLYTKSADNLVEVCLVIAGIIKALYGHLSLLRFSQSRGFGVIEMMREDAMGNGEEDL
jgi:hypothetical protein